MASHMLYVHFRLIRSAAGQKAEAKLVGRTHRECRQGCAVMRSHEVACLPGGVGLPLGQSLERASPFLAKFGLSAFSWTGRALAHAVSDALMSLVSHAIMPCIWIAHRTDEVPQHPGARLRVRAGYKSYTKGPLHVLVTETLSLRLRLWGCQQRHSRRGGPGLVERQNQRVSWPMRGSMESVSPVVQSRQMARRDLLPSYHRLAKKQFPRARPTVLTVHPRYQEKSAWHCFKSPNRNTTP